MMFQYWYTDDFVKANLAKFIGVTNMQCSCLVCVAIYFILFKQACGKKELNWVYRETAFCEIYRLSNSEVFNF